MAPLFHEGAEVTLSKSSKTELELEVGIDKIVEQSVQHADLICADVLKTLMKCPAVRGTIDGFDEKVISPFRAVSKLLDSVEVMSKMPKSHTVSDSNANKALQDALKDLRAGCRTSDERQVVRELEARTLPVDNAAEPMEPPSDIFLSKRLKMGTQNAHKAAESGTFVKRLLRGRVPPEEYRLLLVDLCHVYEALESSLESAASGPEPCPAVQAIHQPHELNRVGSLQKDLEFWFRGEPEAEAAAKPSKAAQAYAARIRELAEAAPTLLLAHAYTRYLGDLSGGAFIKRSICRAMPVGRDGEGVGFYDFENVPDAKSFKRVYRDRLDSLDLSVSIAEDVVEEANKAFGFNADIFRHLDELAGPAANEAGGDLASPPELPAGHPPVSGKKGMGQCPFAAMIASGGFGEAAKAEYAALAATGGSGGRRAAKGDTSSEKKKSIWQEPSKDAPPAAAARSAWKLKAAGALLAAAGAVIAVPLPISLLFGAASSA
jgi:heme oxygenase